MENTVAVKHGDARTISAAGRRGNRDSEDRVVGAEDQLPYGCGVAFAKPCRP